MIEYPRAGAITTKLREGALRQLRIGASSISGLTRVEHFNVNPIRFQQDDAFVDLTAMCRPFEKAPGHFLQLPSTIAFQAVLGETLGIQLSDNAIIKTERGRYGGTWAHPDLALECARWLSPAFAIWCNRVILEIIWDHFLS